MKELMDRDSDGDADISACHNSTWASTSEASKDPSPEAVALLSAPLLKGGVLGGISGRAESWNVVLFCLLVAFLFADTQLMAPNLTAIGEDFGFTPQERDEKLGGAISVAFFLLGAPVALLIGWFADSLPRKNLFCLVLFLGQLPALATLWVTEYWQLFATRTLTGIAIAGATPLLFSMLGDTFGVSARVRVSALISVAIQLGGAGGQFVAGTVGPVYGWRVPFGLVAVPALFLNLVAMASLVEPARGSSEAALKMRFAREEGRGREEGGGQGGREGGRGGGSEKGGEVYQYRERVTPGKALAIFLVPSNLLVFGQGMCGCVPWAVIGTFLNDFLAQDRGMGEHNSTLVLTSLRLGGCAGVFSGGLVGQWLYNTRPGLVPLLMAGTTAAGIVPVLYLINLPEPLPPLWVPEPPPSSLVHSVVGVLTRFFQSKEGICWTENTPHGSNTLPKNGYNRRI